MARATDAFVGFKSTAHEYLGFCIYRELRVLRKYLFVDLTLACTGSPHDQHRV